MALYVQVARKLALLRQNDPRVTNVYIISLRHFDDAELSEAFRTNEHVDIIRLELYGLEDAANWSSLLRVIATREILVEVTLSGSREDQTDLVAEFLLAIQQNPKIQTVELDDLRLSGESMASFLDAATSLTVLYIRQCDMAALGGASAIAGALQRNTNIQHLELSELDAMHLIPIVSSLASNTTLKSLYLRFLFRSISLDESLAVGSLLEATTTIKRFVLARCGDLVEVDTLRPIAQGLIQSKSVTDVRFKGCYFDGQEEVSILSNILESKSNLESLSLQNCVVRRAEFRTTILSLLQPHSSLYSFELINADADDWSLCGFHTSQDFCQLLTAVESSPLERFAIGRIHSSEAFMALIPSIPKMQVETFELTLGDYLKDMKEGFMGAVKRNASLLTVVVNIYGGDWLDNNNDKRKLLSYSARNEFLSQWMENPTVVPKAAWSEYLAVAEITGPETVFRILLSLAPSLGPFEGVQRRKRRRPNFYLPS
jgi:hypothetical protein